MEIFQIDPHTLRPAEYNPRQMTEKQVKDLTNSIKKFGLVDPIIVNKSKGRENIVIGGHQRLKIASILGLNTVPVVFLDLPENDERELNLRLNRNNGEWDWDLLVSFDKELLQEVGFDEKELAKYFPSEIFEDEVLEVPEQAVTQLGDLYQLGRHRLLCGDSTSREEVARLMDGRMAEMVFTDPPYNVDYGVSKKPEHKIRTIENDKQSPEDWKDFCHNIFINIKDFTTGDIYIWGASSPEGMRMRLWLTELGCHWSATIVWKKQQLVLSPANYQRMYEPCFYGWFNKSSWQGDRTQTEVWEIDRPRDSKLHPTMKPIELCAKGITNSSPPEAVVLDLFLGSGSTLVACEQTNRICYGMELDPKYCDVIIKRWENLTQQKAQKLTL